jgi:hypothetical protein
MRAQRLFARAAVLTLTVGMAACEDDDDGTDPDPEVLAFRATMNGANERPNPITTAGTGTATFTINDAETSANWSVTVSGLTSNINNAHIHLGNASVAGSVIILLGGFPSATSGTWSGTITNATALGLGISWPSLLTLIRNGETYVNVHTVNNGGGEIRGQLVPAT